MAGPVHLFGTKRQTKTTIKNGLLQMPVKQGGLAVPNLSKIRLYQLAAQLWYIAEWINNYPKSVWLGLESFNTGNTLSSLLFALDQRKTMGAMDRTTHSLEQVYRLGKQ